MSDLLLVGAGGFVGSAARYALSLWITGRFAGDSAFPWGTLSVNVLGSFVIGTIVGAAAEAGGLREGARLLLLTGVLGGFTTFSAFSNETLTLLRGGHAGLAAAYVAASVAAGLAAVCVGYFGARAVAA